MTVGWAGYAEFRVIGPPRPTMHVSLDGASRAEACLALVLAVVPLCLPCFDLEPLHGSATMVGDRVVLILGRSGAGKTTTAAHLLAHGHVHVTDDACALDTNGLLWPGPPLLAIRDHQLANALPARVVRPFRDKVVVAPDRSLTDPRPPDAVVLLDPSVHGEGRVITLTAREAITRLLAQIRAPHALATARRQLQLDVVAQLADRPVGVASFDKTRHDGGCVADAIETWVNTISTNAVARTATGQ